MNWTYINRGNHADFVRDERFEYSVDLRPDMCVDAVHHETVTEPGCDTFGYTTITCEGCGYTYTDHYTLYQHFVEEWVVTVEPTVEDTGIRTGTCALCGTILTEEVAKLDPPEETPVPEVTDGESTPSGQLSGDDGSGSASSGQPLDGNETDKVSNKSDQEGNVMDSFRNPVIIGVILVMVLVLAVGVITAIQHRKRR